ncbi:L-asparagine oxygenase [Streptomyces antimycoticus]|uniref:L-asparagine oxygenase n=1 Tax=Streptomyces antimycoticus TaxID=68175 RepID=A0A499UJU9_9ACTN|nr:TauD/TfdA family dioxygenase [Streptomyces antimycoticus]BBJ37329.1 L-asparagine oxygenase [Streptomyces antimycoticus]
MGSRIEEQEELMDSAAMHKILTLDLPEEGLKSAIVEKLSTPLSPYRGDAEFEELWTYAKDVAKEFPDALKSAVASFRDRRTEHGALLLRGLPVDDAALGPTPGHWSTATGHSRETETYLLAVASLLGEVFSFERQHEGRLVQNMVPVEDDAYTQKGTGSKVFLEWHTEDAYDHLRADFIGILCVRPDPSAKTAIAPAADVDVAPEHRKCLMEPRFHIGVDPASGGSGRPQDGPVLPILVLEPNSGVRVRLDTDQVAPVAHDAEAAAALKSFHAAIPAAASYVTLGRGELLVIDNHRTLHARTAYEPRFDGTDRWLQRVSITTDLARSASVRTRRPRVVDREARFFH